jgi:glycosyltransferase involved in cell wall biosynthesis
MARVAMYYPWMYLKSGVERTIIETTRRSRHEIALFTSHYDREGTYPDLAAMGVTELRRVSVKRTYVEVAKAGLNLLSLRFDPARHDALVICCDGLGPLLTFRNRHMPLMNLCFTPLRAVYDEEYRARLMERGGNRLLKQVVEQLFRHVDRRAWRHFDSVLCNSMTTCDRVLAGGLRAPGSLLVAYPGVAASSIRAAGTFGDYFFLPGRIMWTKNIELAIDAYRLYRAAGGQRRLVIAGMVDRKSVGYFADLRAQAGDLGGVSFETDVSDTRMRALYDGCYCLLLSAFNEDQGLTPLEGMACGKPSIAIDRGGPRESVLNGVTGFLTEPEADAFSDAMLKLDADPALAERMGSAGLDRVRQFTWERFVEVFDSEIDRVVGERRKA